MYFDIPRSHRFRMSISFGVDNALSELNILLSETQMLRADAASGEELKLSLCCRKWPSERAEIDL